MAEYYLEDVFSKALPDCGSCDYNQQYTEITGSSFKAECQNICEVVPDLACGLASLAVQTFAKDDQEYRDYKTHIKQAGGKDA